MEISILAFIGFLFAAYAVIANDSVQTLGTFISSNKSKQWWIQWIAASSILILVLVWSWCSYGGDISFGRLGNIPLPENIHWGHVAAPLLLLVLTRFGLPVSTTFLVLSAFASSMILNKMILKSVMGYAVAAVAAYSLWFIISRLINEHKDVPESSKKWWRIGQWASTGFLWSQWLAHDMANIAVYLPRKLDVWLLVFVITVLTAGLGVIFYIRGGKIQQVVLNKSGTRYVRSATIIDLIYALILLTFKEWSNIPMSTTWVFVGLLCGRELAVYRHHPDKKLKSVFPILLIDFFKIFIGLALSVALALIIQHYQN